MKQEVRKSKRLQILIHYVFKDLQGVPVWTSRRMLNKFWWVSPACQACLQFPASKSEYVY